MKKIIYLILILIGFTSGTAMAQVNKISGVVTDNNGNAIVGASVVEKDVPGNGTNTNASGRFTLTLKGKSHVLVVTYVGYEKEEYKAGNNTTLQIVLKTASGSLSDVVVVGYGKQKKITTTGAISTVSGAELRENPSASIQNTMAGKLPGFFSQQTSGRPGADGATFYIRGQSSYNGGSNTPLIIVDDIEFTYEQFARIDPNEIESLSILKDASTTAVYGVRGANGVVIVTTRRGKIGAPQISFRGETSIQQPTILPHYLNSYETAKLVMQAQTNDGVAAAQQLFKQADLDTFQRGLNPYTHPDVNWRDVLFKNFSQQYRGNFDISGGTEKVKYFISAGYLYQNGMLKNYGSKVGINNSFYNQRYNYRSNLDMKATATTDLRLDLYGNVSQINQPQVGSPFGYNDLFYDYGSFLTLSPFAYPLYNPDGSLGYSYWQRNNSIGGTSYDVNNVIGRLNYLGYTRTFENNMNLVGTLNQKLDFITRGLSVKGTVSYASSYGDPGVNTNTVSMSGADFPSFIYDPTLADPYVPRNASIFRVRRLIRGSTSGSTYRSVQAQAFINYDRTFGGRHHVYGLALYNKNSVTRYNSSTAYNFIPNNLLGYTVRLGYDYKQKYLLELNAARNGSDRFSKAHRYGLFPAVSAGWNVSEEKFIKEHFSFLNRLKLRGSYGLVGNDKIGTSFSYLYTQVYTQSGGAVYFGDPNANSSSAVYEGTLGNDEVSWEKEKKLDLAVEGAVLNSRLSFVVDYFNNNRYDILTSRANSVSAVFGQTLPAVNLGKVNNKGIEIQLNWEDKIGKNFSYAIKGSYSYAKNTILFQDEPSYKYGYQSYTNHSIGSQRVYTWIGFYDSASIADPKVAKPSGTIRPGDLRYADLNGDGVIDGYDLKVQGYPNVPNTTAGLQISVAYKNFSIGVFFQGSSNFNVSAAAEAIRAFSSNMLAVHQQSWTPALGNNAKYPLLTFTPGTSDPAANPSTFWQIPGDYIRLKTAEVGYTLPEKWVKNMRMKNIRIYSNGYNLFTWTKLSKLYELDPEITLGTSRTVYPPQRIINFGITATF
ncbi:SusC/RagA family TonB-linked outer membrane protein [Ferruginibacter sp.]